MAGLLERQASLERARLVLESAVEGRLKWLEGRGFKCLKFVTPGVIGVPDRIILRPKWSPGAPYLLELKRPGKTERALQAAIRDDWRARGVLVLDMCDTPEKVHLLCTRLLFYAEQEYDGDLPWARTSVNDIADASILAGV